MYLNQTLQPSIYYMGFNMLDHVIGGFSERARKLRQAISIAVNYDENIAIFIMGEVLPLKDLFPRVFLAIKRGKKELILLYMNGRTKKQSADQ